MIQQLLPARLVGMPSTMAFACRGMAIVCLALSWPLTPHVHGDDSTAQTRRVRLRYAAEIRDLPEDAREARLWLPFPPHNDQQQISNITVTSDVPASVSTEDEYGNQILSLAARSPFRQPVRVEVKF